MSNLDAQMRLQMRGELSRLHHQLGATMIYVTHDQAEAMTLGDRIAVMKDGRLQQVDDPVAIYRNPANRFVASFMGSPPMNFFNGQVARGEAGGHWFAQRAEGGGSGFRFPAPASFEPGRALVLGLRPEHIGVEPIPGATPIEGRVELVEMMGAETFLHLSCAGERCVARIPCVARYDIGSEVRAFVLAQEARFFDPETGGRLSP
ncbi:MAG: TOBE domain-containing protein [Verrucomicrobia bacterium]|nr:TOBE domain-containing protein [Verrucomicrobiota bacterium]